MIPSFDDDGLHVAAYLADVSGNARLNASDAARVARLAALLDDGLAALPRTDPMVLADISGNRRINAADASLIAQFAALIDVPQIPPIPVGRSASVGEPAGLSMPDIGRSIVESEFTRIPPKEMGPSSVYPASQSDGSVVYSAVDRLDVLVGNAIAFWRALGFKDYCITMEMGGRTT